MANKEDSEAKTKHIPEAEVIQDAPKEVVTQRRTNQTGMWVAFTVVALFVGGLIGYVSGFVSGRVSDSPRAQFQLRGEQSMPRGFQDRNSSDDSSSQDSWGGYL